MNKESKQLTILPWHREAEQDIGNQLSQWGDTDMAAIIARHDPHQAPAINAKVRLSDRIRPNSEAAPWVVDEVKRMESQHAETLRLLAAAEHYVPGNAVTADWQTKPLDECRLLDKIRAHLVAQGKGTQ